MSTRFAVIVPTLDEADEIEETLARAAAAFDGEPELLVIDGGSRDGTREIAERTARVLTAAACRGAQIQHGVAESTGEVVVLLHADTWLPSGTGAAIEQALRSGVAVGCLTLEFRDAPAGLAYDVLARAINARTRLFRTATGDQAIFATRETIHRAGGIPAIPIFEDVRFVRAARRTGRFARLTPVASTSARRWKRSGFTRTIGLHLWLRLLHALGASPESLAKRYGGR